MNSISKADIDKNFGKLLREYRLKNNLTQEQLSEKLAISLKYISRIENGNNGVKAQTLIKCMNILGITTDAIYRPFITNEEIIKSIEITDKILSLTEEKREFINSMTDLLKRLN